MVTFEVETNSKALQRLAGCGLSAKVRLSEPPQVEVFESEPPKITVLTTGATKLNTVAELVKKIEQSIENHFTN
jgi:hypothetical protein